MSTFGNALDVFQEKPPSYRYTPSLEVLEERATPSAVVGSYADGVWLWYPDTGGWNQISPLPAEQVEVANNGYTVVADYGNYGIGLWKWTAGGGWSNLSWVDPENIALSDSGILAADFGNWGIGLWEYLPSYGWYQLTGANPEDIAIASNGTVAADFGWQGVWRWDNWYGWSHLTWADAEHVAISSDGLVYGDFGYAGTWLYHDFLGGWYQLTYANAYQIAAADYGFYGEYDSGLHEWTWWGGWNHLTSDSLCGRLAAADYREVGADYGTGDGTWYWSAYTGWMHGAWATPYWLDIG